MQLQSMTSHRTSIIVLKVGLLFLKCQLVMLQLTTADQIFETFQNRV